MQSAKCKVREVYLSVQGILLRFDNNIQYDSKIAAQSIVRAAYGGANGRVEYLQRLARRRLRQREQVVGAERTWAYASKLATPRTFRSTRPLVYQG